MQEMWPGIRERKGSEGFMRGENLSPGYGILSAFPVLPGDEDPIVITIDGNDYGVRIANPFHLTRPFAFTGLLTPAERIELFNDPHEQIFAREWAGTPHLNKNGDAFPGMSMGTKVQWEKVDTDHPAVKLRSEINRALKGGMTLEQVREIVDMMSIEQVMDE